MKSRIAHPLSVVVILFLSVSTGFTQIRLNKDGYFEAPGFRFLVYQNTYLGGRLGGLEMILQGRRVLDAGNVVCWTTAGHKYGYYDDSQDERGELTVNSQADQIVLPVKLKPLELRYQLVVSLAEGSIEIQVQFGESVDWESIEKIAFRIEIYPEEYEYKTFSGGGVSDYFHEQPMRRRVLIPEAKRIVVAPEDPLRMITFEGVNASLSLRDERRDLNVSGYMLFAAMTGNSSAKSFALKITPSLDPNWRKEPVVQLSQVGYHPGQRKVAVLEVDPRTLAIHEIKLLALDADSGLKEVKSAIPEKWGDLYSCTYYTFDFSDVQRPGQYFLIYDNEQVGPFEISPAAFKDAWHSTMDVYFPTQMCHVKVRDFLKIWHGACHVEDALQAAAPHAGKDGYRQGPKTETRFSPYDHIPGIDWGGWHDAADFDLPTGSICETIRWLALAQEEFQTSRDVTTILRDKRLVELSVPDNENDMLQQIAFGMEWLLALLREIGHIPSGVISHIGPDYGAHGDPSSITDGLIYDSALGETERTGGYSGRFDDRWVYTTRNGGNQYQFVQVAAICSRVFRGTNDSLATECLRAAQEVWDYEQSHKPALFSSAYTPKEDKYHSLETGAAAELFLATGGEKYRRKLLSFLPFIREMPSATFKRTGFILARAQSKVSDQGFSDVLLEKARVYRHDMDAELAKTPYNVGLVLGWGSNWSMLVSAAKLYHFVEAYPDLFDPEMIYSVLNYVLGGHPASNHSFVSGVGAKSATVVYGFNRWDRSYQPGGVISGVTLVKPDFLEYRGRPWDWYQTEHVIGGSAAYVFTVLAVDNLLNRRDDKARRHD